MSQVYSPAAPTPVRKERVEFPDGRFVYVWGLSASAFASIKMRAARHPSDPRGGDDQSLLILLQIVASCYAGEEPGAARIFSDLDIDKAGNLTMEEMVAVLAAIQRVNGQEAKQQEVMADFLAVTRERTSSNSTSTV